MLTLGSNLEAAHCRLAESLPIIQAASSRFYFKFYHNQSIAPT